MSAPGTPLSERLAAIVAPLTEEQTRLTQELDQLNSRRDQLRDELRQLSKVLNDLNGTGSKPGPKAKPAGSGKAKSRPAPDNLNSAAERIQERFTDQVFSIPELVDATTDLFSHDVARRAAMALHDDGQLRLINGGGPNAPRRYRWIGG